MTTFVKTSNTQLCSFFIVNIFLSKSTISLFPDVFFAFFILSMDIKFTVAVNRGRGGGMENPDFYTNIQYSFMNIPNLHAMRASFTKLLTAVSSATLAQQDNINWLKTIHDTKWLYNNQQVLSAAAAVADQVCCFALIGNCPYFALKKNPSLV